MALYRLEAQIIGRKYAQKKRGKNRGKPTTKTRSVVAASAYRSGTDLYDERAGKPQPYHNRSKGVLDHTILCPEGAPAWAYDPQKLWNIVEAGEKRKDSQLAREFTLAVPLVFTPKEQFALAVDWVKKELVSQGMIAELSLHHPKSGTNPHVHVLCTMRKLDGDKFSAKKAREWNPKSVLVAQRKSWCEAENAALEKAGFSERVDHRTLKAQGIDRLPQPKIGKAAMAMKRSGAVEDPERFQLVRHVRLLNDVRPQVRTLQPIMSGPKVGQVLWFERSRLFVLRLGHKAASKVKDTWQSLVGKRPARGPDISR